MRQNHQMAIIAALASALLFSAGCRQRPIEPVGELKNAQTLLQNGDTGTARDILLQAVADNPQSLSAQVNLAIAYWNLGDMNAAIASITKASDLAPSNGDIIELYGQMLIDNGNAAGAIDILATMPEPTARSQTLSGIAAAQINDPEAARFHLEQALEIDEFYAPALYNLAVVYRDLLNNDIEARDFYERFSKAEPAHALAKRSADAFLQMQTSPMTPVTIPDVEPPTTPDQPVATTQQSEPDDAETASDVASQTPSPRTSDQPQPPTVNQPKPEAQDMILHAQAFIERGELDTALLILKQAVQQHPDNADAVWALANFYDQQLDLKERAAGLYRTFISMFPNDPRISEIDSAYLPAQEPQTPPPPPNTLSTQLFRQGLDFYNQADYPNAIRAFRQLLQIDPRSASGAYNLGLAYKAADDLDNAATAFNLALKIEPDMIKSLYMLGLVEKDRANRQQALTLLNRLIRIQPDFAKAHFLLGSIYETEKRLDMAAIHFERYINLEPDTSAAAQAQAWLDQYRRRRGNR